MMAAIGAGSIQHADDDEGPALFDRGFRQFVRDMISGLREDMRTIMGIRTMRFALVGVAALLFTITAIANWLPQYYERHLHFDVRSEERRVGKEGVRTCRSRWSPE